MLVVLAEKNLKNANDDPENMKVNKGNWSPKRMNGIFKIISLFYRMKIIKTISAHANSTHLFFLQIFKNIRLVWLSLWRQVRPINIERPRI